MQIKGLQKTTLLDFPGKIACVVFTPKCNFKCGFCYNSELVFDSEKLQEIPEKEFFEFLENRKKIIEGVVVSGGEPTLQKDLQEFLQKVKKNGFLTKLDTNGYNPEVLEKILQNRLADYVAMDIKGSKENYEKICGTIIDFSRIEKSIKILKKSKVESEFRITVLPKFHSKKDFEQISEMLNGARKVFLQQFVPTDSLIDKSLQDSERFSRQDFEDFKKVLEKNIKSVGFRNLD